MHTRETLSAIDAVTRPHQPVGPFEVTMTSDRFAGVVALEQSKDGKTWASAEDNGKSIKTT